MFNIQKPAAQATLAAPPRPITVPRYGGKPGAAARPKRTYTPSEIKELLKGYIPVAPDAWGKIPRTAHVRYIKKDGTFVRGGFLTNHWTRDGKKFFHLASGFDKKQPGYSTWPVAHESLDQLFKKNSPLIGIEMGVVRDKTAEIIHEINKLVDVVKSQRRQIDALERDMSIVFTAIKLRRPPRPATPQPTSRPATPQPAGRPATPSGLPKKSNQQ